MPKQFSIIIITDRSIFSWLTPNKLFPFIILKEDLWGIIVRRQVGSIRKILALAASGHQRG